MLGRMTVSVVVALLLTVIGLLVGLGLGYWWAQRQREQTEPPLTAQALAQRDEQLTQAIAARDQQLLELAQARFREAGLGVKGELESRKQAVEHLVSPIGETLQKMELKLAQIEKERLASYAQLTEQVRASNLTSESLRQQTTALVTALKTPQARGQWGEMQLRRVMEIAGMLPHCDFDVQVSATTRDGVAIRPDAVVRLAGGKSVVVDAKVPLTAYLEAAETQDDQQRAGHLSSHARALRMHVDSLAKKEYWSAFEATPEFVVLFVPGEAFLAPALANDPSLLDDAMGKKVIIATPTTMLATLRSIGYAWQQEALTANARQVFEVGRSLYKRLSTMGTAMTKLGGSLTKAVDHYNSTVGTMEKRVFVDARRMAELGLTHEELATPEPLEAAVRPLTAPELLSIADFPEAGTPHPEGNPAISDQRSA